MLKLNLNRKIDYVVQKKLCTECGACWGVCPKDNIQFSYDKHGKIYYYIIDHSRCGHCSLCIQICPGIGVDFRHLHSEIFHEEPKHPFHYNSIGPHHGVYLGKALDINIFQNGATAGVTTAMLAYALENLDLDGVFVAKMNKGVDDRRLLSVSLFLARNRHELISGQQSKYMTVPMAQCLRHILYEGRKHRFAFVGIGCHMHALRKAEQVLPQLKERIVLRMGIFCGHCMDQRGTRHLLGLLGTKPDHVHEVQYRSGQWPGHFSVTDTAGHTKRISHLAWTSYVMTLFEKWRCHFCPDPLNQWADISAGDPWLPELYQSKGQNIVIPRTEIGKKALDNANEKKYIQLKALSEDQVIKSQHKTLYRKRKMILAYNKIASLKHLPYPSYTSMIDQSPLKMSDYMSAFKLEFLRSLAAIRATNRPLLSAGRVILKRKKK